MSKHTPGPWIVLEQLHPYKDGSKSHVERGIYTQQIDPQLKDHWPVVCLSVGIGMDGEKAVSFVRIEDANARLIAAAPELLKALKECRNAIQGGQVTPGYDSNGQGYQQWFGQAFIEHLGEIIAKATGGAE